MATGRVHHLLFGGGRIWCLGSCRRIGWGRCVRVAHGRHPVENRILALRDLVESGFEGLVDFTGRNRRRQLGRLCPIPNSNNFVEAWRKTTIRHADPVLTTIYALFSTKTDI